MSVNDAIAAVPSHYEYVQIDQEVLAKPLQNLDTFKECKVTQNDHFKVKLAVWDGKVVGADVSAPPAKKECIDRVVRATVWLTDMEHYERVNRVYAETLGAAAPARVCIEVSRLPRGARVEIDAVAEVD